MGAELGWTAVVGIVMVVGLVGVVLPVLPGLTLMWAAALAYGFLVGWSGLGVAVMALATVLVAAGFAAGILVPRQAAAAGGASGTAQLAGLVGAVIGFFLIPVVGVLVGALAGIFGVELARHGDRAAAWSATVATARGFGLSILIELGLGFALLVAWTAWAITVVL